MSIVMDKYTGIKKEKITFKGVPVKCHSDIGLDYFDYLLEWQKGNIYNNDNLMTLEMKNTLTKSIFDGISQKSLITKIVNADW